jgi:small GTP-binding protein
MPINASHEYFTAEKAHLAATTPDEKISTLEELIRKAPKHKGSENLLKQLRLRLKKLKTAPKKKGGSKKGIRKEGFQVALVGLPNSGKSSLMSVLTNTKPKTSPHPFTTQEPLVGSFQHDGIHAQLLDLPAINNENFDSGFLYSADLLLICLKSLDDLKSLEPLIKQSDSKRLYLITQIDTLSDTEKRKAQAQLDTKKLPGLLVSCYLPETIEQLKNQIAENSNVIRVYTKEPHKPKTDRPLTLSENATVADAAKKISKAFAAQVKSAKVTGPSAKFPNQSVGLKHRLKDRDVVEFHS